MIKTLYIWYILIWSVALFGQEVIYLEQNIETSGMEMDKPLNALTKSWIAEDQVRIEQPGQIMLLLFDEKKVMTLITKEKQYIEMSFAEMDQLLNLSNMFMQGTNKQEIVFEKTGLEQELKNWEAYQIKSKTKTQILEIWLSESVGIDRTKLIKMYEKMPGMSSLVSSMKKSMQFPGFPVLTKVEMEVMGMEMKTTIELIKAEKKDFSEELFKIPADYKQIDNPLKMLEEN
jgi:hypothetical protein